MSLILSDKTLRQIHLHGEEAYPEEGAGLLLGKVEGEVRQVVELIPVSNARQGIARRNRYLLTPQDMMEGERQAERLGLVVIGVFHSHPDHPDRPSEFDREWALPWFSYLITSVKDGEASRSRSWRLTDDRSRFLEEKIIIHEKASQYAARNT